MAIDKLLLLRPDRVDDFPNGIDVNRPRVGDSLVLLDQVRHQDSDALRIDGDVAFVVPDHDVLDAIDRLIGQVAGLFYLAPPRANEIVELATVAARAFREHESFAALATVGGSGEIVAVLFPGPVTGHVL